VTRTFVGEWIKLLRPLFPRSARIEVDTGNDLVLRIDWKLRSDPNRPNKRSRLIRVVIPQKAVDGYDVKTAGSRLKQIVQDKLSLFNPDHDTRRCGRRPIEEWVVSTLDGYQTMSRTQDFGERS